jgi:SET family sugar efflux transporter-like MFS transporter
MRFPLKDLALARPFGPIAIALLFSGLGDAISGPYGALFFADRAHLSPIQLGSILTVRAFASIVIASIFGRWYDVKPSILPLVLALGGAVIGNLLLAFTTDYVALLIIVALPLGTAASAFPQLFALGKGHLDRHDPLLGERGLSLLRALWSVAWAAGPAIGAFVIEPFDFRGVFIATALCGALSAATIAAKRIGAPDAASARAPQPMSRLEILRAAGPVAAALTLFHMAMFMGSIALSISITHTMGGTKQDVGHAVSLCAFLEVLVMLIFVARPARSSARRWMMVGFLAFAAYHATVAFAPTVSVALFSQVLRAIAIGIVACLGIGYAQAALRGRVGAAAALFANSVNAGLLLSGLGTGVLADAFGYHALFGACAVLSGLGLSILVLQQRAAAPESSP